MTEEKAVELHQKKSDMNAANPYQYHKLETARFYFIPCAVEETYDELKFTFDMEGMRPISDARTMKRSARYGFLLQVLEAITESPEYSFSLNPDNLFLDSQDRVCILKRDLNGGNIETEEIFQEIKALAGFLLQKRYSYENIRNGGLRLLKKQKKTRFLLELKDIEEAEARLREIYLVERDWEKREYLSVGKRKYHSQTVVMWVAVVASVLLSGFLIYLNYWQMKPKDAALRAERAYLENDLTGVIDALEKIPAEQLDRHEKYILAVVAIRGQSVDSFPTETKDRLISRLSYKGDENLLDYWIHLGRLEADQAIDAAMRMSDNQLLLYAYLQKLELVSSDTTISGEFKSDQMNSLKERIKTLANELGIEYQNSDTGSE